MCDTFVSPILAVSNTFFHSHFHSRGLAATFLHRIHSSLRSSARTVDFGNFHPTQTVFAHTSSTLWHQPFGKLDLPRTPPSTQRALWSWSRLDLRSYVCTIYCKLARSSNNETVPHTISTAISTAEQTCSPFRVDYSHVTRLAVS